jgi:hypothetical protein
MAKQKEVFGPSSDTHKQFLNCKSDYIIFGGGKLVPPR